MPRSTKPAASSTGSTARWNATRTPRPGELPEPVLEALCDDLNTPLALARMRALADAALAGDAEAAAGLRAAGALLGLAQSDPAEWFRGGGDDSAEIEALIVARADARRSRDFKRADEIRAEIAAKGVVLEDGPAGTTWRRGS